MIAAVALAGLILCIAGLGAFGVYLMKRDAEKVDTTFRIAKDPRTAEQLSAGDAIAQKFADIRQERGVDRHGRLKPARCSAREAIVALPYSKGSVTDLREYAIRHQAG